MKEIKRGMKNGIPIALGYLSVSFSFGAIAVSMGFSVIQAVLISLLNLTSAGQFASSNYSRSRNLFRDGNRGIDCEYSQCLCHFHFQK